MQSFHSKTAVVTGAASGIGRAIAGRFAEMGMQVVLADVEPGPLEAAVTALRARGADAIGVATDVSDPDSVNHLAAAATDAFGPVHVLVNNAGVGQRGTAWELPMVDWHWVFGVCFWGVVHGVRSFLPQMIAHGEEGYVVNTSSMLGMGASPERAPYETSKQAVTALTEGLYLDLQAAAPQLHVALLCPGYTATNIRTSRRNHPTEPAADVPTAVGPSGAGPDTVAGLLLEAMRQDRFYVFAEPDRWLPSMRRRFDAIIGGGVPQPIVAEDLVGG
jgi:NAD(P)-dependent dehydrogenase (short-subunit alcohol dehydrogenase family)